jgi:hypothetical protein
MSRKKILSTNLEKQRYSTVSVILYQNIQKNVAQSVEILHTSTKTAIMKILQ